MIGIIIAALSTRVGRAVVIGLGAAALFFSWLALHDHKVAKQATTKIVDKLNTKAEALANEAAKARAPALRAGAASRLRDATNCRDCE
jgi:hypothetical protein